jgi:hypothetical protein
MEGEEDLEDEDGLGKSCLVFVLRHVTWPSHVRLTILRLPRGCIRALPASLCLELLSRSSTV